MDAITELLNGGAAQNDNTVVENFYRNGLAAPDVIDDFRLTATPSESSLTPGGERVLGAFKPFLDNVDWHGPGGIPGPSNVRKQFEMTYKLMTACAMRNLAKSSPEQLKQEATLAGTDIPTFTRQLLRTIIRVYPQLITPGLFPVVPLNQSTGKYFFEKVGYDSVFASSAPSINPWDYTHDLDKFNADFFKQPGQLENLGLIKMVLTSITVEAATYGVASLTSRQAHEDFSSDYGRNLNAVLSDKFIMHLSWVIDRIMMSKAETHTPSTHKVTWKRKPTINSVLWANQTPSEKQEYRKSLWNDGFLPVMTAIFKALHVRPNWAVAGANAGEDISNMTSFRPFRTDDTTIVGRVGGIQDLGTLDNGQMRILLDPQMNANRIQLGYRPPIELLPSLAFCPLRAIGVTEELVYPRSLKHEKSAYTRFAVAEPQGGNADSDWLAKGLGQINISDDV